KQVMNAYFELSDALAASRQINNAAANLSLALDSLSVQELEKDTLIYQTALQPYTNLVADAGKIAVENEVKRSREVFNRLSNELFAFLSTIRYDDGKFY